jgi:hypothetical protein
VKGSATVGGPNGHQSNGSEIEGRPDPRLKAGVPDGVARRSARQGQTRCLDGVPDGAGRGARRVAKRCSQTGCPTGGQTGWPEGVPDWA